MRNSVLEPKENFITRLIGKTPTYLFIVISIFLGVSLFRNISNVRSVNQKIDQKEKEVAKIQKEQEDLQKELEFTKSREYIEQQLRDKLGLAKEGETVVIMPPPEVLKRIAPKYEEEKDILPDPNWKRWLKLFL
jgi:cell division protein FtsB